MLYTRWETPIEPVELSRYQHLLETRSTGRPVHYIIGEREFMGLAFVIDERVMIRRPETEILVAYLVKEFATAETRKRGNEETSHSTSVTAGQFILVDSGTGSGCIAVSLAHYLPQAQVYATDISQALEVAAQNARRHNVADRVIFLEADLLAPLPPHLEGNVEAIASNPPYVRASHARTLAREIREFEPAVAVSSPGEGITMHTRLIEEARRWLRAGRRGQPEQRVRGCGEGLGTGCGALPGDYLAKEPYEEWPRETRDWLREKYLAVLLRLGASYASVGQLKEAGDVARRILEHAPWT